MSVRCRDRRRLPACWLAAHKHIWFRVLAQPHPHADNAGFLIESALPDLPLQSRKCCSFNIPCGTGASTSLRSTTLQPAFPYILTSAALFQTRTNMLPPAKLGSGKDVAVLKTRTWLTMTEAEIAARQADSDDRRRQLAVKMPAVQYELEKK